MKQTILLLIHRSFIILYCLVFIAILMFSAAHFIQRMQAEQSSQSLTLFHSLIKQISWTMVPLIANYYNNVDSDNKQIQSTLDHLSQQQWILEASIYQLDGRLIAESRSTVNSDKSRQLVEKIRDNEQLLGFIRLTIDDDALSFKSSLALNTARIIWVLILLAVAIGFILAKVLQRKESANITKIKSSTVKDSYSTEEIISDDTRLININKRKRAGRYKDHN